jgi:hypothetical protein
MGVVAEYLCDGCDARATARLTSEFVSVSGRGHGFGARVEDKASKVAPEGWVAFDPYTGCTYCATCWADITREAG